MPTATKKDVPKSFVQAWIKTATKDKLNDLAAQSNLPQRHIIEQAIIEYHKKHFKAAMSAPKESGE